MTYDNNNSNTMHPLHTTGNAALFIKNASGRYISILNHYDGDSTDTSLQQQCQKHTTMVRRKYRCAKPGCNKIFTTSGHLSRHQRIHTGEKNFQCFYQGCPSRFSRQDNMMQHYRTHLSPRSRRMPWKSSITSAATTAEATPVQNYRYNDTLPESMAAADYNCHSGQLPQLHFCPQLENVKLRGQENGLTEHSFHHHNWKKPKPLEPVSPSSTRSNAAILPHVSYSFTTHSRLPSLSSSPSSSASEYII
ncbi:hypothetical protein BX666DRAFT_2138772 [Dichotomocladium elegans]|nr:hypothetical protein BX666DRAFT_2138772 [Dichotomocladium elegans]